MDLLLTVALPGQGPETRQDMLVSVQEGTTVADLAWTLHERLGPQPLHAPGGPDAPGGPGAWAPGAALLLEDDDAGRAPRLPSSG